MQFPKEPCPVRVPFEGLDFRIKAVDQVGFQAPVLLEGVPYREALPVGERVQLEGPSAPGEGFAGPGGQVQGRRSAHQEPESGVAVVEQLQGQSDVGDALGLVHEHQLVPRHQTIQAHGVPGGKRCAHDRVISREFQGPERQLPENVPGQSGLAHLLRAEDHDHLPPFFQPLAKRRVDFPVQEHELTFPLANTIAKKAKKWPMD